MDEEKVGILVYARDMGASSTLNKVSGAIGGIGKTAHAMGGHVQQGIGKAIHTIRGFGLAVGALLGLGALGSAAGIIEGTVGKMNELAFATEKLTGLTGLSAQKASALLAVFGKFGVGADQLANSAGFAEKTLGKLNNALDKNGVSRLTQLEKEFGVVLHTASGRVIDYYTELKHVADYYTSNASASNKAALAATLFGRGYAALIPVLRQGGKGIDELAAEAQRMGLTLTKDNVFQLAQYREAMRGAGEAVGGLELQIGLGLAPTITALAKEFTRFVTSNRAGIQKFFVDATQTAKDLGHAFTTEVVPGVQKVFSAFTTAWNKLPPELKQLLIGGLIVHKLTGGMEANLAGDLLKGGLGALGRGGSGGGLGGAIAAATGQRVFVTNWPLSMGPTGPNAGPTALEAGAAGAGLAGAVGLGLTVVAVAGFAVWADQMLTIAQQNKVLLQQGVDPGLQRFNNANPADQATILKHNYGRIPGVTGGAFTSSMDMHSGKIIDDLGHIASAGEHSGKVLDDLVGPGILLRGAFLNAVSAFRARQSLYAHEKRALHGRNAIATLGAGSKADALLIGEALAAKFTHSQAPWYQSTKNKERTLVSLEALAKHFRAVGDTKSARAIGRDLAAVQTAIANKKESYSTTVNTTIPITINYDPRRAASATYQVNSSTYWKASQT